MTKWETLIHFIEDFNDEMVLLTKLYNPKNIVLVTSMKVAPDSKLQQVSDYLKRRHPHLKIIIIAYEAEEILTLNKKLVPYLENNPVINLAGASALEVLYITQLRAKYQFTMLYPSIGQDRLYIFEQDSVKEEKLSEMIDRLNVKDYLDLGGGLILQDEKQKYETPLYKEMLAFLKMYYEDIFSPIRHLFKPTYVHYSATYEKDFYFEILKNKLTEKEQVALVKFLKHLKIIGWIQKYEDDHCQYRIYCTSKEMEHYLTSGAWLEHITYDIMKQLTQDVHTGFKFAWHMREKHIHNELDVVATRDNQLICISCKDTDKYDYQTLNELMVYATRLGGSESIKILVTTMPSFKSSTMERAKGMKIEIVQLDKTLQSLEKKLKDLMMHY